MTRWNTSRMPDSFGGPARMFAEEIEEDGGGGGDGDGDGGDESWRDSLPEDIRGSESIQKYGSVEDMVKGFIEVQPLIGADKLVLPGKDATPEQMAEFHQKLGRPEKSDGYTAPTEGLPDGLELDQNLVGAFRERAFELGITTPVFTELIRWFAGEQHKASEAQAQVLGAESEDAGVKLKNEWGVAYDERVGLAKRAFEEFGTEEFGGFLSKFGLDDHPQMLRIFSEIGKSLASDPIKGAGSGRKFQLTPADALSELNVKERDTEFMADVMDSRRPGHEEAKSERKRLYDLAYNTSDGKTTTVGA